MNITYEHRFGLPRNVVWKYIKNEKVLRNSIPGCKSFVETSKGVYQAELDVNIGPIQDVFSLKIRFFEKNQSTYQLRVEGKGNVGEVVGKADLLISEVQGGSKITCRADADVTGALALAGKSVLDSGASKGLDTFFEKLEKQIKRTIYEMRRNTR
ncbi:carbon monoxide dehydrogenase subunit G [Bacillus sp. SORGH_AS 510]|uniref:CoxG family protein n=1 Tax=Bacillus sp. SORGH_AS_0510 TaxID=3041771 RepID=UPI00277F32E1|nr:SRPBCC domain-containing protein [Bacillus sp. SORGH_AS_0510]MDQ1146164.1 carbon monoxide dehydrogenase subunit G [Bacillus sp. SORGH_AS_0510]